MKTVLFQLYNVEEYKDGSLRCKPSLEYSSKPLSVEELEALKEYIDEIIANNKAMLPKER
jgi:hypothetical protein